MTEIAESRDTRRFRPRKSREIRQPHVFVGQIEATQRDEFRQRMPRRGQAGRRPRRRSLASARSDESRARSDESRARSDESRARPLGCFTGALSEKLSRT